MPAPPSCKAARDLKSLRGLGVTPLADTAVAAETEGNALATKKIGPTRRRQPSHLEPSLQRLASKAFYKLGAFRVPYHYTSIYTTIHPSIRLVVRPSIHPYIHTYIYVYRYVHVYIYVYTQVPATTLLYLKSRSRAPDLGHRAPDVGHSQHATSTLATDD